MAMTLALHAAYQPVRLERVRAIGLDAIQLRLGPGFPIDLENPDEVAAAAADLQGRGISVVSLGVYRNVLDPDAAVAAADRRLVSAGIRAAREFGTRVVSVFAGRHPELSIEDNIPLLVEAWTPLVAEAEATGVCLAFENCSMFRGYPVRGINTTHNPAAYRLFFDALPSNAIGIEFDPSHCLKQLIDPVAFLRAFPGRTFHVHLKDHERIAELEQLYGCFDVRCSRDRFPGFGQVDFASIISELRAQGYEGALTIEAERDPDFATEDEIRVGLARSVEIIRAIE